MSGWTRDSEQTPSQHIAFPLCLLTNCLFVFFQQHAINVSPFKRIEYNNNIIINIEPMSLIW